MKNSTPGSVASTSLRFFAALACALAVHVAGCAADTTNAGGYAPPDPAPSSPPFGHDAGSAKPDATSPSVDGGPSALDAGAAKDAGVADAAPDVATVTSIDLSQTIVRNSPPDVATWPVTAMITQLDLEPNGAYINFTKRDGPGSWPDVPFGAPGDSLEYTLWIVINVNGQWYTSGCIEYWRGLDRNGGPPAQYAANWYYDPNRWAPMTGHQPAVGEQVGFFVTAGNARNVTDGSGSIVKERSNIVIVPFPPDAGQSFTF